MCGALGRRSWPLAVAPSIRGSARKHSMLIAYMGNPPIFCPSPWFGARVFGGLGGAISCPPPLTFGNRTRSQVVSRPLPLVAMPILYAPPQRLSRRSLPF
jgi:hypothetical protein